MATTVFRLGNSQDKVVEWNTTGVEMYPIPAFINLFINRLSNEEAFYRGADKSLARPGRKQATSMSKSS
jgi:hypothetical protein